MSLTIKGCHITINFLFIALIAILLLEDKSGIAAAGLLAAALHELGHLSVMTLLRVKPLKIQFNPCGIDIIKSCCTGHSYRKDIMVSLAGPGINLLIAMFLACFHIPATLFIIANLAMGLFNLLPIEPLDGGQALYCILCTRFGADRSSRIVAIVSFCVIVPLAAAGFLLLFRSPGNFSLFLVSCYLMALLLFKNGRYY
jgi:stage IV sporulation protein FB